MTHEDDIRYLSDRVLELRSELERLKQERDQWAASAGRNAAEATLQREHAERTAAALRAVEWAAEFGGHLECCPHCQAARDAGEVHLPDCIVAAALQNLDTSE